MFASSNEMFQLKKNELMFEEICSKLKIYSLPSPWSSCFILKDENSECEVQEFFIPELGCELFSKLLGEKNIFSSDFLQNPEIVFKLNHNEVNIDEEKLLSLKTSLMSVQDTNLVEHVQGIELLSSLSLSQIPTFCDTLFNAFLNETSIALFLTAILNFEKPLGITIAAALVNRIIYPKILSLKAINCRNLSLSVLNFSGAYPKAVIEEILVPCLKRKCVEAPLLEILLKVVKFYLPEEYVAFCIKNILDEALPTDYTFLILQYLIERKIPYDNYLHNALACSLERWISTNNIKFTKLLISILTIYGTELSKQQMKIYSNAIEVNNTVMKKAVENIFKKLKLQF